MAGQSGGVGRVILWLTLIGLLGLVVGAVIGGSLNKRGSNIPEVTRLVEVTREVVVDRPVEVTRVVATTRIVEIVRTPSAQISSEDQSGGEASAETTGSVIIGVLTHDGQTSLGTHTVALFPKTLINDAGQALPNRDQEINIPVNGEIGFAEAYGLEAGTYVACLKSLLHTATVGEIEIITGKTIRVDLYWPADITRINVECVLDS